MREERGRGGRSGVGSGIAPHGARRSDRAVAVLRTESLVLDVVYVLGAIALFVIVGLLGRAVEKL
ncbi:hypothetical protein [Leifsonia sp. SIMBA_070]|uniref:hypothetical protein n=1 Tax=Leifsonia sp. SIMBA_070 TaxID=3085810 RepID=UPI003979CFCC